MSNPEDLPDAPPTDQNSKSTTNPPSEPPHPKKKKKRRKKPSNSSGSSILTQFPIRKPTWCYIHLQHLSSTSPDTVTAHLHLTAALKTFLGLHGTAIPFDILKLSGQDLYIRIPAEDRQAVIAAVGGWTANAGSVGWRVKGWSFWDASATNGKDAGQELFD